ncbi:hypothetical protein [Mycobacterium marinum]|nr:hypothetical protein [Mycobacterium marinum]WCS16151.1 hypothetical protein MML61_14135 [Mycobacterium marinum]WOR02338.1 hypothetical protein QDR78_13655 [Mycobacterium marinum]
MGPSRKRGRLAAGAALVAVTALFGAGYPLCGRPSAEVGCAGGRPVTRPVDGGERVIVDYFNAVNDRDYGAAWGYLGRPMRAIYGATSPDHDRDGLAQFSLRMDQRVRCVRVTEIVNVGSADPQISASMGIQWYRVTLDAEYVAAAGALPAFYKASADPHAGAPPPLIMGQATSL